MPLTNASLNYQQHAGHWVCEISLNPGGHSLVVSGTTDAYSFLKCYIHVMQSKLLSSLEMKWHSCILAAGPHAKAPTPPFLILLFLWINKGLLTNLFSECL